MTNNTLTTGSDLVPSLQELKAKIEVATGTQLLEIYKVLWEMLVKARDERKKKQTDDYFRMGKPSDIKDTVLWTAPYISNFNNGFELQEDTAESQKVARNLRMKLKEAIEYLENWDDNEARVFRGVKLTTEGLASVFNSDRFDALRKEKERFAQRGNDLSQINTDNLWKLNEQWLSKAINFLRDLLLSNAISQIHKENQDTVKGLFMAKLSEITEMSEKFRKLTDSSNDKSKILYSWLGELKVGWTPINIFEKFKFRWEKYGNEVDVELKSPEDVAGLI